MPDWVLQRDLEALTVSLACMEMCAKPTGPKKMLVPRPTAARFKSYKLHLEARYRGITINELWLERVFVSEMKKRLHEED